VPVGVFVVVGEPVAVAVGVPVNVTVDVALLVDVTVFVGETELVPVAVNDGVLVAVGKGIPVNLMSSIYIGDVVAVLNWSPTSFTALRSIILFPVWFPEKASTDRLESGIVTSVQTFAAATVIGTPLFDQNSPSAPFKADSCTFTKNCVFAPETFIQKSRAVAPAKLFQ
jgi:hypothetical protein